MAFPSRHSPPNTLTRVFALLTPPIPCAGANYELPRRSHEMTSVSHPISPVWAAESQILILGTMPSPKSREVGFFYMHPQNRFWSIMAEVFGESFKHPNNSPDRTGKNAFNLWQKNCAALYEARYNLTVHCLPSTSPANAQWSKEKLIEEYSILVAILN